VASIGAQSYVAVAKELMARNATPSTETRASELAQSPA